MRIVATFLAVCLSCLVQVVEAQQTPETDATAVERWPIPQSKVLPREDDFAPLIGGITVRAPNEADLPGEDTEGVIDLTRPDRTAAPAPLIRRPGEDPLRESGRRTIVETKLDPPKADTATGEPDEEDGRSRRFKRVPVDRRTLSGSTFERGVVPIRVRETELRKGARLRQLDKMTGQIKTFDLDVGQTVRVDRLQVELDACRSPMDNDTHGTMAFLRIWDTKHPGDPPDFTGWMFAESPGLSALDHPRYDLWVISCTTSAGEASVSE